MNYAKISIKLPTVDFPLALLWNILFVKNVHFFNTLVADDQHHHLMINSSLLVAQVKDWLRWTDRIVFFLLLDLFFHKAPLFEFQSAIDLELFNFVCWLNKLQNHGFGLMVQGTIMEEFLPKLCKPIELSDGDPNILKLYLVELNRRTFFLCVHQDKISIN